jgi:hypothetical protein
MGGRLILTKTCLSNVTSMMMAFFRMPKGVIKRIDSIRAYRALARKRRSRKVPLSSLGGCLFTRRSRWLGCYNLNYKNIFM